MPNRNEKGRGAAASELGSNILIARKIGEELRSNLDRILAETLPKKMSGLLAELERTAGRKQSDEGGSN